MNQHPLLELLLSLAIGLLIGTERGWHERDTAEGRRVAGVRTFGLIGLLGGLWAVVAGKMDPSLLGFAFLGFTALIISAHLMHFREDRDVGITTVVAALITFALGALSVLGNLGAAAASAVITAVLLSMKPVLHKWIHLIEPKELYAALKLLLISVVLLPVLPDRGFGPNASLNPHEIWWMVVLIAAISFAGYVAIKIRGTSQGVLLTGLLGGLVSSTVVTINLANLSKKKSGMRILAAGALIASAVMFPRILLVASILNRELFRPLLFPMIAMGAVTVLGALWIWKKRDRMEQGPEPMPLSNPFELVMALKFGLLLSSVIIFSQVLRNWLGETGVYIAAAISGLGDVDAITLSMARLSSGDLPILTAVRAIVLASLVNTATKGFLFAMIAGFRPGMRLLLAMAFVILAGALALYLLPIMGMISSPGA